MQSQHKPRFSHWLIEQVGTGQYAGLCYVEQNTFRVPWKHNSRKDCNEDTIFREWAVVSGKIHEFPNDKAKWKTNFRCALNALCKPPLKRFKRIQDNSRTMPDDPHKVYEIINTGYNYGSEPMEGCLDDPDIYSSPIDYFPPGNEHTLVNYMRTLELNNDHTGQQQCGEEICVEQSPAVPVSYAVVQPSPVEPQPVSQNHTQQIPQQASYYSANPEPVQTLSPYDLEISIHYRRKEVLKTQVSCSRLQLHCHHEAPEPNNICFPTTECLLDHKQIRYTNQILNSIQRGLLLEVRDTGIYACRQSDKCRVFASTSDPSEALSESSQLPQNTMMQLLSFDNFVSEWKQFKNNQGGSPHYTINICFGEKFPDGKPMEKKLIMVKVVPLLCRQWHEMAQSDGASSLQSACISLQISHNSHNSLYDLISNAFSLPSFDDDAATPY